MSSSVALAKPRGARTVTVVAHGSLSSASSGMEASTPTTSPIPTTRPPNPTPRTSILPSRNRSLTLSRLRVDRTNPTASTAPRLFGNIYAAVSASGIAAALIAGLVSGTAATMSRAQLLGRITLASRCGQVSDDDDVVVSWWSFVAAVDTPPTWGLASSPGMSTAPIALLSTICLIVLAFVGLQIAARVSGEATPRRSCRGGWANLYPSSLRFR